MEVSRHKGESGSSAHARAGRIGRPSFLQDRQISRFLISWDLGSLAGQYPLENGKNSRAPPSTPDGNIKQYYTAVV